MNARPLRRWLLGSGRRVDRLPAPVLRLLGCQRTSGSVTERIRGIEVEYDGGSFIGATLFSEGGFEEPEIEFCAARLRPIEAPVLLDVGANLGWHTLRWATLLSRATIHAFEPAPEPRARLQRNLQRNALRQRVHVHAEALAAAPGRAVLKVTADDAYSTLMQPDRSPVAEHVDVPVTTLDEFVARQSAGRVDFVKIDVEGVEDQVLDGASRILRAMKPDLLVEIYEGQRPAPSASDIVGSLAQIGYRAYVFQGGKPVPFTTHRDWYYNYFFTVGAAPA